MIYRIIVDECREGASTGFGRLGGLMGSHLLGSLMDKFGVRMPGFDSPKARFYFTEVGWRKAGRAIAAEARSCGHAVRVVRRKEPDASQVVFRDEVQVAILPSRRPKRSKFRRKQNGVRRRHLLPRGYIVSFWIGGRMGEHVGFQTEPKLTGLQP